MAHEIVIPRLGWSMEEGTFVGWLKKDGDLVRRGDAVFELEGEKASQDIEAVDEGILRIPPNGPKPGRGGRFADKSCTPIACALSWPLSS